jgi:hypothetical protein
MFNLFKFAAQEPPPDSKTTDSYFEKPSVSMMVETVWIFCFRMCKSKVS